MVSMELMDSDLYSTLASSEEDALQLSWYRAGRSVALDIAKGLHYLHQVARVIHFDVKVGPCSH